MPLREIGKHTALAAVALLAAGVRLNAADDLPKAEAVLDRYIEATGGRAAYEGTHTEIATGSMEIVGMGIQGKLVIYNAEPNQSLTEIEIEGIGKILEGTDGQTAWSLSALQGPRLKEGGEKSTALREARFNAQLHWRDLYKQAETAGPRERGRAGLLQGGADACRWRPGHPLFRQAIGPAGEEHDDRGESHG